MILLLWVSRNNLQDNSRFSIDDEAPESSVWDDEKLFGKTRRRGHNVEDGWSPDESAPSLADIKGPPQRADGSAVASCGAVDEEMVKALGDVVLVDTTEPEPLHRPHTV